MKHKKKIIVLIIGLFSIATILTAVLLLNARCVLDGTNICYDDEAQTFRVEENAAITVQVESESMKTYLENEWNTLHPENTGALIAIVRNPLTLEELGKEGIPYDLAVTSQTNAAFVMDQVYNMGNTVVDQILFDVPTQLQDASNAVSVAFVPNSAKGWLFVYNKTLVEELGYDLTDADNSGLPDVFETWEQIFEEAPTILEKIETVFPFTFVDQESFYPFLTGGRWMLNFTNRGSDPGFESREFLEGLEFIKELKEVPITKRNEDGKAKSASELAWNYETALYERKTMFSIATEWMQLEEHAAITGDEYVYSKFPSYNGVTMSPMASVDGYVMRSTVEYPSATAEALRILRTPNAALNYESSSDKTFVYARHSMDQLTVDDATRRLIYAYSYSDSSPVMTLDGNPSVLSRLLYQEVNVMDVLGELYDGSTTTEEAQETIVERAKAWIESQTGVDDNEDADMGSTN